MEYPAPEQLALLASAQEQSNRRFFQWLGKRPPGLVDAWFHDLHQQAFEEFDCLECANCCKSISPMVSHRDVERLAAKSKMAPGKLVEKYLLTEPDGSFVFRNQPCPFLDAENYCIVYSNRPKACAEYPHTDRRRMHQILPITLKNTAICPIVFAIVDQLKADLAWKA